MAHPAWEASIALAAALRTVTDLRVTQDVGASVDPPAAIVGPPQITRDAYHGAPTGATFQVYLVVSFAERAVERLLEMEAGVAAALEAVDDAVVTRSDPAVFNMGGHDLPAYQLTVEVAL